MEAIEQSQQRINGWKAVYIHTTECSISKKKACNFWRSGWT